VHRIARFASLVVLFVISACRHDSPPAPEAVADLVLPGTFSEQTTVEDLRTRFGASNVTIGSVPNALGDPGTGVVLFPDDPTRRAKVRFYDEAMTHLASVTVTDAGSRWRGKLGIRIGTSFAELRQRNGVEFWFTGFDADRRGMVRDAWNAGALDVTEGELLYFGVDLRLREAAAGFPASALPNGDEMISSDDPRYPKLGELVEVSSMTAWSSLDDE
jgi:hypothetical protein